MMKTRNALLVMLLSIFLLLVARAEYKLTILDSGSEATAYGLNKYGYSCGYATINGTLTPCVWNPDGERFDLPSPFNNNSSGIAYGINDFFEVGGHYGQATSTSNFVHKISYGTSVLWALDEENYFEAFKIVGSPSSLRAINNWGDVCGDDSEYGYVFNVFDGSGYDSPVYGTEYFALNQDGDATGYANGLITFIERQEDGDYQVTTSQYVGTNRLDGFAAGVAVNIHDQVVGSSTFSGGFVWNPKSGTGTMLGSTTRAWGINDSGVIVGDNSGKACIWNKSGTSYVRTDLDTFADGYELEIALAINNKGQIVGRAKHTATGVKKAFLLTPVYDMKPSIQIVGSNVKLSWHTQVDTEYQIETSTNLAGWTVLPTIHEGDGAIMTVMLPKSGPKKFFRIVEVTD